ncbi:MAG TPA: hypothetical protein VIU62_07035, partial [Chloroflexota bacterium]
MSTPASDPRQQSTIHPPWLTYGPGDALNTWLAVFGGGFLDPTDHKSLNVTQPNDVACMTWMKQYVDLNGGWAAMQDFITTWSGLRPPPQRLKATLTG